MRGILLSQMNEPPGHEDRFHEWYDTEHIPDRLVIPGFTAASRYEAVDAEPRWLVIYEADDLAAFDRPEYVRLKAEPSPRTRTMLASISGFTRYLCDLRAEAGEPAEHDHVGVEAYTVAADRTEEFEAWDDGRADSLTAHPQRRRVHRYRVLEGVGGPWTHLVVHELASPSVWDPDGAEAAWLYRRRSRQEAGTG